MTPDPAACACSCPCCCCCPAQVTKMKMISPSNREVDVGKTLSETEYIGMCR